MILQFIICTFATLSFALLFGAAKSELVYCGLTGAFGWIVYLVMLNHQSGLVLANLIATFALTLIARIIAAVRKNPVTVYLISGIFPLVPGAGIYYTSYHFIMNDKAACSTAGTETIMVAGAIVLGIIFGSSLPQSWFNALGNLRKKRIS